MFCVLGSNVCTPIALVHTCTCSYLMFAHALFLWLFVIVEFNKVSRNADYRVILPRETVGLSSCQSVLLAFLPTGENITLLKSRFCLKPPYLMLPLIHYIELLACHTMPPGFVAEGSFQRTSTWLALLHLGAPDSSLASTTLPVISNSEVINKKHTD